jgi:lysophospholipase L1-like esterase/dienelactone hydrolase
MMRSVFVLIIAAVLSLNATAQDKPIKVACIGASITYGATIPDREQNSYPAQLQKMLGNKYEVTNYGVSGTTMLRKGNLPYWKTKEYQTALASSPDIVFIDLGGNDAKLINRKYDDDFEQDAYDMVQSFAQLPSHPRVVLMAAMPSWVTDTTGIWDPVIVKKINPHLQHVAYYHQLELLDMHAPFANQEANTPDKIHPNKEGAKRMAELVYENIIRKKDFSYHILSKIDFPQKTSSYYGYKMAIFKMNDRECRIVEPKWTAPGRPWLWRARFWGHEPQTDIAMLQRGYHLVYFDAAELLGNAESIKDWNDFYNLVTKAGLGKKACMEGMSRGGVYVLNWAAANPKKVAAVYIDNPLLNIPSWAMSVIKAQNIKDDMFQAFKKDFNLVTDDDIKNFKGSPVDKVKQIVKGKYPILILCADEDEAVYPPDNTLLFEKEVLELKGDITVIHKPGFKHHPHSLPNPTPIVDFLLRGSGQAIQFPEKL